MFADYKKINDNVKRLISAGAPKADIDAYIKEDGGSVSGIKRYNEVKDKSLGQIVSDNFVSALKSMQSEVVSPVGKGLDTAAFGLPRTMLKAFNPELDKSIFPDQETLEGKTLNIATNVRGLLVGGAAKLAEASGRFIPKVAGEGLKRQVVRGAIQGSVGAGSQFIGDPAETILDQIGRQAVQAFIGGAIGSAVPIAGKAISKTVQTMKEIKKGAQGYVSDVIAPKMSNIVGEQINKMNPKFVNYVERKMKISQQALDVIRRKGEAVLDEVYAATRGLTDDIESRLNSGLRQRGVIADDAYNQVMQLVPEEQSFNVTKTQNALRKTLIKKGLLDEAGERTARAGMAPGPDKILLDVNDDILRTDVPTKNDFIFWREKLSSAYKEVGYTNIDVKNAIDNLYDDAVDSGYKGLQEARALYRRQIEMEKKFLKNALLKQNKLNKYDRWSVSEKAELDELISYIQNDFPLDAGILDDLNSTIASRDLQILKQKISPGALRSELTKAQNPENFNTVKQEWFDIVGDDILPVFDEVRQAMRGQTARRVAEKAIIPVAASLGVGFAGYGAYRLGSEGIHELLKNVGGGDGD